MLKILKQPKCALPIFALLVLLALNVNKFNFGLLSDFITIHFASKKPPMLELDGKSVEVSAYQYLGSWPLPDGVVKTGNAKEKGRHAQSWKDTVRLVYDDDRKVFHIDASEPLLGGSIPRQLTPDAEDGVFGKIAWQDNQVSVLAFRALSGQKQTVVAAIDTDSAITLYVNGKQIREVTAADAVELGANLLIPVSLEAGENVFTVKVLSIEGPPQLRMGLVLDQSKDAQAAWNKSWGFLNKLIYDPSGKASKPPTVNWDSSLSRLTIDAEIYDILNEKSLFKMGRVRRGDRVSDGGKAIGEGIYRITYRSNREGQEEPETFEECFMVGEPRKALQQFTKTIDALPWSADEKINVDAHLRRARVLFRAAQYALGDRKWEEKVLWVLGNLAEFVNLKKTAIASVAQIASGSAEIPLGRPPERPAKPPSGNLALPDARATPATDIFTGLTGLRLGGYVSKLDNSRQYYRLFVPSYYKAGDKLPMLVILHTTMGPNPRPFLESVFLASHREAVHVSEYAERYGFAVLWPGYRNDPKGFWTYESAQTEEAIEDVEKFYHIDRSRISLYGTCSSGLYAGRMVSTYPNRFAAIVYDRAFFDWDARDIGDAPNSFKDWIRAINPSETIIANKNIKIIVLNDGTRSAQHGPISASREFLRRAQAKRDDITYALGQRKIGVGLWNSIFGYLVDCKIEHPDSVKVDVPAANGYAGPISDIFATPCIFVEGTRTDAEGAGFIDTVIENLRARHKEQFFNPNFVLKKDTEITDEDIEKYSLVLIGNAESNAVWSKLAAKYGERMTPYNPPDDWPDSSTEIVFAEVFKSPVNKNNYLLLIGAKDLGSMIFLENFNPFTAWFDSYVYKYRAGSKKEYVIPRRP